MTRTALIVGLTAVLAASCGGSDSSSPASTARKAESTAKKPEPASATESAEPPSAAEHGGVPKDPNERPETPHGGTMIVVGDKVAQIEAVFDPASGTMAIYVYGPDGHSPMKVKKAAIDVQVTPEGTGAAIAATLPAVEDAATGDKPGDAAHFKATIARLKGVARFEAVIRDVMGGSVVFGFPQ